MTREEVLTYTAEICIAGDQNDAIRICRAFCMANGFCVTVTPTTFVYTGGAENGVLVRCINYPRFPSTNNEIWSKAEKLAEELRIGLYQHSFSIVAPDRTLWVTERQQ